MLWSLSICWLSFLFLFSLSIMLIMLGVYYTLCDWAIFIEWEVFKVEDQLL